MDNHKRDQCAERHSSQTDPEAEIGVITGLRDFRRGDSLVSHFRFDDFTVFPDFKRIFRFIGLVVVQRIEFLIGVFSVTEGKFSDTILVRIAFGNNFALLIPDTEPNAGEEFTVRNVLFGELQFSGNRLIDETNARLVLYGDHFAVFPNLKIIVIVVLEETFGTRFLMQEIPVIPQTVHLVHAGLGLAHLTDELVNFRTVCLTAVHIHINFKHSAGQLVVRIFRIYLGGLHRSGDKAVFNLDFDNFFLLADSNRI